MFCRNCGAELSDGATFCSNCGANLSNSQEEKKKGLIKKESTDAKEKKSKKPLLFIAIACLLVIAAIVGIKLVLGSHGKKTPLIYAKNDKLFKLTGREGEKLPADLYSGGYAHRFLDNGLVVFFSGNNDLRLYDLAAEDDTKLASDVSNYWVDENEEKILWFDSDGKLCAQRINLSADKETIDTKVGSIRYVSEDLNRIVYEKKGDVYVYMGTDEPVKVKGIKGEYYPIDTDGDIKIVWAESSGSEDRDLSAFIDDDMAEADAGVSAPNIADYQHKETKDSFWGPREATVTDDKYYEDMEKYEEVRKRNELRDTLKNAIQVGKVKYYVYSAKEDDKTELYDGPGSIEISYISSAVIYKTYDLESVNRVKFSDLMGSGYADIQEQLSQILNASSRMMLYNGKDSHSLDLGSEADDQKLLIKLADKETGMLYFTLSSGSGSEEIPLYSVSYEKNDGKVSEYTDDFGLAVLAYKGGVLYLTDIEANKGELYYGDERIASDVLVGSIRRSKDKENIYFLENGDSDGNGDLYIYSGKKTKIDNDVHDYRFNEKNDIAYLTDYSAKNNEGDLKIYKGGKITDVDDNVQKILYY